MSFVNGTKVPGLREFLEYNRTNKIFRIIIIGYPEVKNWWGISSWIVYY